MDLIHANIKPGARLTLVIRLLFYGAAMDPEAVVKAALKNYLGTVGYCRLAVAMDLARTSDETVTVSLEEPGLHFNEFWASLAFTAAVGEVFYRAYLESYKLEGVEHV